MSIAHSSLCSIIEKGKVHFYAYPQIRRDGVEEVTETDEVSYQEVRPSFRFGEVCMICLNKHNISGGHG